MGGNEKVEEVGVQEQDPGVEIQTEVAVGEYMEVAHFQVVEVAAAVEEVVEHLILEVEVGAEVLQPGHLSFPQSWAYCNKIK